MDALDQLLHIITTGVADIKQAYAAAGRSPPSLDDLYQGPDALELALAPATALVVAASQQLVATLRLPTEALADVGSGVRARSVPCPLVLMCRLYAVHQKRCYRRSHEDKRAGDHP
jgi:hypothetical protein